MNSPIHSSTPRQPRRPLTWPDIVYELGDLVPDAGSVYLVGGSVRDALLGRIGPGKHDFDLATGGDALLLARMLADSLKGAFYPLDEERGVGRVLAERDGGILTLDVARFRGESLLADLRDRDFTVNAMASPLAEPDLFIDPLGGEDDLLRHKVLKLCSPEAIASDPIRALRAVRFGLHFKLKLDKATLKAVREDGRRLADTGGDLVQPERARNELFKLLGGFTRANPAGAVRLLDTLALLNLAFPILRAERASLLEHLARLLLTISPARTDNTAANLTYGLAVMTLDRHRKELQEHLSATFGDGRSLAALLGLAAFVERETASETADRLRLSNAERDRLRDALDAAMRFSSIEAPPTPRDIHRYFRGIGEAGIDGVLLGLAAHLDARATKITQSAEGWSSLLDEIASPLLDGFFRRHQQYVVPPPLLTGDDVMSELDTEPGPRIGEILTRLLEEQAAGEITTHEDALRLVRELGQERSD